LRVSIRAHADHFAGKLRVLPRCPHRALVDALGDGTDRSGNYSDVGDVERHEVVVGRFCARVPDAPRSVAFRLLRQKFQRANEPLGA